MAMVGIASAQNLELIRPEREDDLVECFEEFAESGLTFMSEIIGDSPTDIEGDRLVDFLVDEYRPESGPALGNPHETDF